MTKTSRPKYIMKLKNINTSAIEDKYDLSLKEVSSLSNKTKISDLGGTTTQKTMVFFGPSKQLHKCNVSIIDHGTGNDITMGGYHCFWCRHNFNNLSIGCPISHNPKKTHKEYRSMINNNNYYMEEDSHQYGDSVYISDGAFCSFNCCMSYIDENIANPLYSKSKMLLIRMYNEMFNRNVSTISPAPHWRTLSVYGGHMTISEFRDSFDKIEYQNHGTTRNFNLTSIGTLFEKKLKF